jgi:predicted XRE-type DNA-binding protein
MSSRMLPENASTIEKIKFQLCEQFVAFKLENSHVSQKELAQIIGIHETILCKVLHYHFEKFTIDRLIKILETLYSKKGLEISIKIA